MKVDMEVEMVEVEVVELVEVVEVVEVEVLWSSSTCSDSQRTRSSPRQRFWSLRAGQWRRVAIVSLRVRAAVKYTPASPCRGAGAAEATS